MTLQSLLVFVMRGHEGGYASLDNVIFVLVLFVVQLKGMM